MSREDANRILSTPLLRKAILRCRQCPRLVEWRQRVASEKVARFQGCHYWGKPVPSLGKPDAGLLIVGLAPAAHGGNRTGRIFTGDRSGDWLYRALYESGFANQPVSVDRSDGMQVINCYITAVLHCAPPQNRPLPSEIVNCRYFLTHELQLLPRLRVIVALGKVAFDQVWTIRNQNRPQPRPKFQHGLEIQLGTQETLIASFHPSQQNTFTGKLTVPMFHSIFRRARQLIQATSL